MQADYVIVCEESKSTDQKDVIIKSQLNDLNFEENIDYYIFR